MKASRKPFLNGASLERGFSVVEAMIAMVIIVLAGLGIAAILIGANTQITTQTTRWMQLQSALAGWTSTTAPTPIAATIQGSANPAIVQIPVLFNGSLANNEAVTVTTLSGASDAYAWWQSAI